MTCSKIFSGDLPELTYGVIKYFQNDHSTLYSCTLINRLWCRLAIPLLWENPFSSRTGNYNFIEIYLHNITDDIKTELNECKIINNSLPSNTLFNYLKFLKYLNTFKFIISVEKWVETAIKPLNPEYRASDIRKLINISLFKIFIENEVNLHTLEIEISELIIKYCKNIKYLDLIGNDDQIIYPVLYLIESIKQNLNHLSISTSYDSNGCSSIILQNLGQHIPYKLEYLHLFLHHIKIIDFEVFLKNSQNTFIKKLLIYSIEGQDILPSIKKYILKKKRVEYLSFFITPLYDLRGHSSDLSSFNNEVKEFGLYNIKVQSYSSLVIRTSDFIKGN
ncbi:unnamed protein product [Rhizophagus irregularis]|nr:unnamed protein product [Rhizophagus irregularis]